MKLQGADVYIGKGNLDEKGVFANRDFKEGEVVIEYYLRPLSEYEYSQLDGNERMFTHTHWGRRYLYSVPERYVNHSTNPNTLPDLKKRCDVAIRHIKKGEEITTDAMKDDSA